MDYLYIDGVNVATISTHVPANTTALASIITVDGQNSDSSDFNINFYYVAAVLGF